MVNFQMGCLGGFSSKSILPPESFSLMRMGIPRLTHAVWAVCSLIIRIGQGMHTSFEVQFINSLNQSPSFEQVQMSLGVCVQAIHLPPVMAALEPKNARKSDSYHR